MDSMLVGANITLESRGVRFVFFALLLMVLVPTLARAAEKKPRFIAKAEGGQHTLAIDAAGKVWTWGGNSAGQLGTGSYRPTEKPVAVTGLQKVVAVAAGRRHSLALDAKGRVWSWGAGQFGQTGKESHDHFTSQPLPDQVRLPALIRAVAAGDHHNLALDAKGQVWAWGANEQGQLGIGTKKDSGKPVKVKLKEPAAKIFAQGSRSGALATSGETLSWGGEPRGKGDPTPRRIALAAAWFRESLPQSALKAQPPALAATTASKASDPTPLAVPRTATPVGPSGQAVAPKAVSPPAHTAPSAPASAGPPLAASAPGSSAAKAAVAPIVPPSPEKVLVRGRVLMQFVGSLRGLAGVEVRAGNIDCSPTDGEGWFECRVPAGFSGAIRPRKAKYRFSPSVVSLERVLADMDSQQYFTAIYEPF